MKYFWYYLIFINLFAFCTGENAVNPCTDRWKCRSNRRYDVLPA